MSLDIDAEVCRLQQMTVGKLLEVHRGVFGEPSHSRHKEHLVRQIAWRMQCREKGRLSEQALRQAAELVENSDLRVASVTDRPGRRRTPARPPIPGTVLCRPYKGKVIEVKVLEDGFEFDGQVFRTLSALARAVTGSHWNGNFFFGIPSTVKRKKTNGHSES